MTRAFHFDRFTLDIDDRQLKRGGNAVELNARYFDALALMVASGGQLVSKDRFLGEVWRGVPVTDEALTQCIRTLRKQLGDDAAMPRFIETVPKHGYRFIAPVEERGKAAAAMPAPTFPVHSLQPAVLPIVAGTAGGAVAGVIGGLFYGFAGASGKAAGAMGELSVLLVILALTVVVAIIGAAGVSVGIAGARYATKSDSAWNMLGGAIGGLVTGALVKLIGIDAFTLLIGNAPPDMTGPLEGLVLGAAVGGGSWLALHKPHISLRRSSATAAAIGGVAGALIALAGGRLMGGSLDLLARSFPGSRLRLDPLGAIVGESHFGLAAQVLTAALEAALFAACIVGAMVLLKKRMASLGG